MQAESRSSIKVKIIYKGQLDSSRNFLELCSCFLPFAAMLCSLVLSYIVVMVERYWSFDLTNSENTIRDLVWIFFFFFFFFFF